MLVPMLQIYDDGVGMVKHFLILQKTQPKLFYHFLFCSKNVINTAVSTSRQCWRHTTVGTNPCGGELFQNYKFYLFLSRRFLYRLKYAWFVG